MGKSLVPSKWSVEAAEALSDALNLWAKPSAIDELASVIDDKALVPAVRELVAVVQGLMHVAEETMPAAHLRVDARVIAGRKALARYCNLPGLPRDPITKDATPEAPPARP